MAIGRIPEPGTGIPESIIAAKGDILTGTANDTPAVLTVGTDGYTLVADSAETTGLKWAAPAGGGKVLQVVNATQSTAISSSSNVYADTGLTATITPSAATSKILVLVNHNGNVKTAANSTSRIGIKLLRGATEITNIGNLFLFTGTAIDLYGATISASYLDSPNTTSATTYKTQFASTDNTAAVIVQANTPQHISFITLIEIGA